MGSEHSIGPWNRRRLVGAALGVTLIPIVFVAGLVFANAVSAERVAANAAALHWTNSALGTAALTRAALVQASTFLELENTELVPGEDTVAAMAEVTEARARLADLVAGGGSADSLGELRRFLTAVDRVVVALEQGDHQAAKALLISELEPSYVTLTDRAEAEQATVQERIDASTAGAARVTDFMSFLLTLGIPASAILVYRFIARRQLAEFRLKTELALEKERAVGRAKDEFIAGLSHELKTPLTSIYGFAEVLSDGGAKDPDTALEMSRIIANESAEMTRMVEDLLAAARLESTTLTIEARPTRIDEVVESAIIPFRRARLRVERSVPPVEVETDPARLRHVLVNLLSNAAHHGGPHVGVEASAGVGVVDIVVWDDGPGVPEDQLESLFDTFIHDGRATLMTGTLGLGLGVAAGITELLGGRLSYQRVADKTSFVVTLPVAEAGSGARGAVESEAEAVVERIRARLE